MKLWIPSVCKFHAIPGEISCNLFVLREMMVEMYPEEAHPKDSPKKNLFTKKNTNELA